MRNLNNGSAWSVCLSVSLSMYVVPILMVSVENLKCSTRSKGKKKGLNLNRFGVGNIPKEKLISGRGK